MVRTSGRLITSVLSVLCSVAIGHAADYPAPVEGTFVVRDFQFTSGETLPELRLHYRTIGEPRPDADGVVRNAVLVMHGTTGSSRNFLRDDFAGELFGPGQLLDASRYFIVMPDAIGHGGSSKPSDGLRGRFPKYGYRDIVTAQYRLVTEGLGIGRLRLVMGTSMGGMHTWVWGQTYPDFVDALMPLASLPTEIAGRNRVWRKLAMDAIVTDPDWQGGDYGAQPRGLRFAAGVMALMSSNPILRQGEWPSREAADRGLDEYQASFLRTADANDVLYAIQASWDYDPRSGLGRIAAPLVAVNFADDLINPPELGILEREVAKVPRGRAVTVPLSEATRGHSSHTIARLWLEELAALLEVSKR